MRFPLQVLRAPMAVSSFAFPFAVAFSFAVSAAFPAVSFGQTPALVSLPKVLVTATRFAADADGLPYGVSVITAQDIQRSGVDSVNQALMKLLGVPGRQDFYGGGDYALDLRGFGGTADNNQVIVLDGVKLNEADLGGTRLAGIPIDSVERIEVIRGSGSVLYGEGATGGVILITTRAGTGMERVNAARVTALAGSFGRRDGRASATLAAGSFSLDLSAGQRQIDNYRDNFSTDSKDSSFTGQWRNDWLRMGATHSRDALQAQLPGSLSAQQYATNPKQTNTPDDRADISNERNAVFAQATLGDWRLALDAGWREKSLTNITPFYTYQYEVAASTQALRAKLISQWSGLSNDLVFGADAGRWERTVLGTFGSVANQKSIAFYVRDELTLPSKTKFSAGFRTESIRKSIKGNPDVIDQKHHAWEIGVLQPLSANVSAYARIGTSFRLPNVDEFSFVSPNAALQVQESRDVELGARWKQGFRRLEARLYRSSLSNEIGYDPNAASPYGPPSLGANVNFEATRRQGLELESSLPLLDNVTLHVNAALRESQFVGGSFAGKRVPLTPRKMLSLRAEWQPSAAQQVDLLFNHVGSQTPDFDNLCSMPAYATVDLRYAYRFERAELAFGVSNLTDRKHYTQAFSCTAGEVNAIYPEAGRAMKVSLSFAF